MILSMVFHFKLGQFKKLWNLNKVTPAIDTRAHHELGIDLDIVEAEIQRQVSIQLMITIGNECIIKSYKAFLSFGEI